MKTFRDLTDTQLMDLHTNTAFSFDAVRIVTVYRVFQDRHISPVITTMEDNGPAISWFVESGCIEIDAESSAFSPFELVKMCKRMGLAYGETPPASPDPGAQLYNVLIERKSTGLIVGGATKAKPLKREPYRTLHLATFGYICLFADTSEQAKILARQIIAKSNFWKQPNPYRREYEIK